MKYKGLPILILHLLGLSKNLPLGNILSEPIMPIGKTGTFAAIANFAMPDLACFNFPSILLVRHFLDILMQFEMLFYLFLYVSCFLLDPQGYFLPTPEIFLRNNY